MAIVLSIGLALLSLALLVLMLTRWGQARLLTKCVVLSVFAHALLLVYSSCTELFLGRPVHTSQRYIMLNVVGAEGDGADELTESATESPSDQLPARPASPEEGELRFAEPPRQEVRLPDSHAIPAGTEIEFSTAADTGPLTASEPLRPVLDTAAATVMSPQSPAPAPIESPTSPAAEAPSIPAPEDMVLPRQELKLDSDTASVLPTAAAPQALPAVATLWQSLVKSADSEPLAGAVSDLQEVARQAASQPPHPKHEADVATLLADPASGASRGADDALARFRVTDRPPEPHTPQRLADGAAWPEVYALRLPANRRDALRRHGGNVRTEEAVANALIWLAANQQADGRWDASASGGGRETRVLGADRRGSGREADTAITGLALLALLGSGQTHLEGRYQQSVERGIGYLLQTQAVDGNLSGQSDVFARMYCHGIASLALSEAYGVTGDRRLRPAVERALGYTVRAQHPTTGGWRYQPGDQGDTSQFGWQLMALESGAIAGSPIPAATRSGMFTFLRQVSSGEHGGLASYRRGERATRSMTAEALVCRLLLNRETNSPAVDEATTFVLEELPTEGEANLYYWYYGTLAMFQVQGEPWRLWNEALQEQLLRQQRGDATLAGSWDPDTVWGGYGGRVYSTALATLCLEVYYRYLPITQTVQDVIR